MELGAVPCGDDAVMAIVVVGCGVCGCCCWATADVAVCGAVVFADNVEVGCGAPERIPASTFFAPKPGGAMIVEEEILMGC